MCWWDCHSWWMGGCQGQLLNCWVIASEEGTLLVGSPEVHDQARAVCMLVDHYSFIPDLSMHMQLRILRLRKRPPGYLPLFFR
jgi:hypothetical protein